MKDIISSFENKRVLIIGDVMIDAYIWGSHTRMSPEAPVPVVDVIKRDARLGGAANVALNVQSVGAEPIIVSVIGEQGRAEEFKALLEEQGMSAEGIIWSQDRTCTVKTRVISNDKHMMRVDEEQTHDISPMEEKQLMARFKFLVDEMVCDAVILQDYNKGVLTTSLIRSIIDLCKEKSIPVTVDPKTKNFMAYEGCDLFKPNLKELKEGLGMSTRAEKSGLDMAVADLQSKMPHKNTMITLSEHGVYVSDGSLSQTIPAHKRNIVDVSGAGDTVIAIATLALASKASNSDMAWLANLAGGLVCEKVGVQPIEKEALMNEIMPHTL